MSTVKKPKIACTNRILVANMTLYTSCDVVREVRQHLVRVEQKYACAKDQTWELLKALHSQIKIRPAHFSNTSKTLINNKLGY